jgi:hypothetical protein
MHDGASRFESSKTDRNRSLDAIHLLELHAGSAAPGRQQEWLDGIQHALETLRTALAEQADNSLGADSLLSTIPTEQPHLGPKIDRLRRRYQAISEEVGELHAELSAVVDPEAVDVADIRMALDHLATELRYQRARESDLVYEAYAMDLGEGD